MENLLQAKPVSSVELSSRRQTVREVLVVLFFNTLICTLVAFFVWLVLPVVGQHGFFSNWVYSQFIGQTICIGSLLLSFILRKRRVQFKLFYFFGCCVLVPLGFYLGITMAASVLADPIATPKDGHIFWTSLLVTIFVSLFSILFYSTWHHVTTLKLAAAQNSARASRARLSMLQAQVEPHMLFNTLSNLRSLIDSDPPRAQHMLDHLVDFLRATLDGSQQDSASLKKEFELLENYLSLMEIRMGERLSFNLELPAALNELRVPVLILQPIVENAVIHGLEPTINGGHISVVARAADKTNNAENAENADKYVSVDIIDSGVGYDLAAQTPTGGFGLQSVRDRLQSAHTDYEVLSISSPQIDGAINGESGTQVTVRFALDKHPMTEKQAG